MLNLALIPKQQEFESPGLLTQSITFHPQNISFFSHFHTRIQKKEKKERDAALCNNFNKYTFIVLQETMWASLEVIIKEEKSSKITLFSLSLLVLKNKRSYKFDGLM